MASADTMSFATPSKQQSSTIFTLSSSPGLPSPSELFKTAPMLRTGSRAAPIPSTANANFTSASSLLKATVQEEKSTESIRKFRAPVDIDERLAEVASKPKARKPRAKKVVENDEAPVKKPARARVKKTAPTTEDESTVKEKAVRKPRAKKTEDQTQPKLPKARITKSAKGSTAKKTKKILDSGTEKEVEHKSSHKVPPAPIFSENTIDTRAGTLSATPTLLRGNNFTGLLHNFGYNNGDVSQQQDTPRTELPRPRKRKSPEISTTDTPVVKPKAVRKKAKTITDQATAAYVVDTAEENIEVAKRPGAITEFFHYQPKPGDAGHATSEGLDLPKLKIPSKSSKLKPGDKALPILLSPESAIKHHKQQDILFGTSSQLADPQNSPTFIRDVQEALRVSNQIDDDFFINSPSDSSISATTSERIRSRAGRSNLWAASFRDEFGELLSVEVVDLSITPVAKVKSISAHLQTDENATEMKTTISNEPRDHGGITRSILDTTDIEGTSGSSVMTNTIELPYVVMKDTTAGNSAKVRKPSKASAQKPGSRTKKATPTEKPNYSAYTTPELTKAVAAFGFKPVKKRETMIMLLNKCWDGKNGGKSADDGASGETAMPKPSEPAGKSASTAMNSKQASPKRPRGRPKKVAEAAPISPTPAIPLLQPDPLVQMDKQDSDSEDIPLILKRTPNKPKRKTKEIADEILDTDTAPTPSPPRRKKKVPALPSKPVDDAAVLEANAQSSQAELFSQITKAIKSMLPSTSSSEPNWHEKILLYDPIVLEDLTIWLNTGGLESVGWDGEVYPSEVKTWCESRSVCCLWRENLKGGARSRY